MRCVIVFLIGLLLSACNLTATDEVIVVTATPAVIAAPDASATAEVTAEGIGCVPRADWNRVYVVVAGDTLGAIAADADVSIAELAEANCLENPDTIDIGQELRLPGGSGNPAANPFIPTPVELSQAYSNSMVGVALALPANWTVQESDGYIAFFGPTGDIIELSYGPAGQLQSPQEQIAECQRANACLGNREITNQAVVRLPSGISGIRVDFSADVIDGDPGPSVAVYMIVGNRVMSLRTFGNQAIFNHILDSLRAV